MTSTGTRIAGTVNSSSAEKAVSYPQAAAAQHKPHTTAATSSSPTHSADILSGTATDTAHTAPEALLTSSSPPAVSSAAAAGLGSASSADGRTPDPAAAFGAAAAAPTAAGDGPYSSAVVLKNSARAGVPPAPAAAAGFQVKSPATAGNCSSPARPLSPFAAMAGKPLHAAPDSTPAATCHVRVVSIPAGLPPIRTSPEGQPLRLLVPGSARAAHQPVKPSSKQALPYSSIMRCAGGWDGNSATAAAAAAAAGAVEGLATSSAAPDPAGAAATAGAGGSAGGVAEAAVAAAGVNGGEAQGTCSSKAGAHAAAVCSAGAAGPAPTSSTAHPGSTAPTAAAGMKRAASLSDIERQPVPKRQAVEAAAAAVAAPAGVVAGAAPGGSEQQSVQQGQQQLVLVPVLPQQQCHASPGTAANVTTPGGSTDQHPAASDSQHQQEQFPHHQHPQQQQAAGFIGDQNLNSALALLSAAPGQAPTALQRDLLGYAWGVLGCADPRTLLLGWHLHLRVLANRHHLQERMQREDTGLTQDNTERVLTVYCCWQAALMLERDSLQPPEFAEAMGLQLQQMQHLQTAVMTVLAWGDFDSYLHVAQDVLAAAGGM